MWKAKSTNNPVPPPAWEGKDFPKPKKLLESDFIGQWLFLSGLSSPIPSFQVGDVSYFPQRNVLKRRKFLRRNKGTNLSSQLSDYSTPSLLIKWYFFKRIKHKNQKQKPSQETIKKCKAMIVHLLRKPSSWCRSRSLVGRFLQIPRTWKENPKADPKVPRSVLYEQRGSGKWSLVILAQY